MTSRTLAAIGVAVLMFSVRPARAQTMDVWSWAPSSNVMVSTTYQTLMSIPVPSNSSGCALVNVGGTYIGNATSGTSGALSENFVLCSASGSGCVSADILASTSQQWVFLSGSSNSPQMTVAFSAKVCGLSTSGQTLFLKWLAIGSNASHDKAFVTGNVQQWTAMAMGI